MFARASVLLSLGAATFGACGEAGSRSGALPDERAGVLQADQGTGTCTPRDTPALEELEEAAVPAQASDSPVPGRIVFIGTSLTAGYGLQDPELAYPARIGRRIAEAGYPYVVVNAGISGETSAGGRSRLPGLLALHGASLAVLFVELGANDGLRGQSPEALYENLSWIVLETRQRAPEAEIVLAGMEAPPNLGPAYTASFRNVFRRIAEESGVLLIPFLLEGVAAVPQLNQEDGIHPNADGHGVVAEHVWSSLEGSLASRCRLDPACSGRPDRDEGTRAIGGRAGAPGGTTPCPEPMR